MAQYQEQLQRVRRYYDRLKQLNDGTEQAMTSDAYLDDFYAFFQNCHHLKDWLKKDPAFTKHTDEEIEEYVTTTQPLAIGADICNASKHLGLRNGPRSGDEPTLGRKTISLGLTDCLNGKEVPTTIAMQVAIEHDGRTLDAFLLATDALHSWESFVS